MYLVHAGMVSKNGLGVLLPGASGSGKSSLTLALLRQGYDYFSDDLAVIEPTTAMVSPFPKPFSLKNIALFPDLAEQPELWLGPENSASLRKLRHQENSRLDKLVWYIHPDDIRPHAVSQEAAPVSLIIFPTYQPDSTLQLQPLSPSEAMRKLIENSVNFREIGPGGLRLLASLTRRARCYTLDYSDLNQAVACIDEVINQKR